MTTRQINFYEYETGTRGKIPYICGQEPIEYFCDGKEGYIHFDGYYYVENHAPPYLEDDALDILDRPTRYDVWLPQKLIMFTQLFEKEPYKVEVNDNVTQSYYTALENVRYVVEIYKKVIHENTDVISEIEDDDRKPMRVCFFPTNRQTIYFRVIEIGVKSCVESGVKSCVEICVKS
jgi:hypothetical protein